jgi:lambda repressor-like predicted transcriptional regulator
MTLAPPLVADLQSSWCSLHDLDRAQLLKSIHQSGVSLRALSSALNCSPSLLTHLLQASQAPPEDCLLARQGLLSTRALVRRARTVGARRTALHREEIAYERELAALRFSQAIGRWLDEKGVESTDRESVIDQAVVLSSQGRGQGELPLKNMATSPKLDGRSSWPAQPDRDDADPVAQHARRLALWAFHGISDAKVRDRAFELAHADLNRRSATAP